MIDKLTNYQGKTGKTWTQIASEIGLTYRGLRYILTGKRKPSKAVQKLIDNLIDSIKER